MSKSMSPSLLLLLFKPLVINYWLWKAIIIFESRFQKPSAQFPSVWIEENQVLEFSLILHSFSYTTAEHHYTVTQKQTIQSLVIKCLVLNLKDFP